jgi:hypothetical protein
MSSRKRAISLSSRLNESHLKTLLVGNPRETVVDTAMREGANASNVALFENFKDVMENIPEEKDFIYIPISQEVDDIVHFHRRMRVAAANGGTIDVYPVTGGLDTSGGVAHHSGGLTSSTYLVYDGLNVSFDMSAATTESFWIKNSAGKRSVTVAMYHDGTNNFTVNPTIRITIPSGVPGGHLKVIGFRRQIGAVRVINAGAGADIEDYSLFDTLGASLRVSDGSSSYWTWEDGSGNEEYVHHRAVSKAVSSATNITLTLSLTASAPVAFSAVLEVEYFPDSVSLYDLGQMSVDIASHDPIARSVDLIVRYNSHLVSQGFPGFVDIISNRMSKNFSSDILFPQNWNTYAFEDFDLFLDEYIMLMHAFKMRMSQDIGWLQDV